MPDNRLPSIPNPHADPESLRKCVLAMKEIIEVLTRVRGDTAVGAVRWQDLVDLGLITPDQVP